MEIEKIALMSYFILLGLGTLTIASYWVTALNLEPTPSICTTYSCCHKFGYDRLSEDGLGCYNVEEVMTSYCRENDLCPFDCLDGYRLKIYDGDEYLRTEMASKEGEFIEEYNYTVKCAEWQPVQILA